MNTETPKAKPIAAWLLAAAFAVVAGAAAYYYGMQKQEMPQEEATAVQPQSAPADETPKEEMAGEPAGETAEAGAETPPTEGGQVEAAGEPVEPRFDILRLEQDGSAVIAGSASPSSEVELLSGGSVIGSSRAGPAGDFAIVLDEPLAKGDHELTLRATAPDGATVTSSETGIVSIPESGGELMAMVSREGEASRVMQTTEPTAEQPAAEQAAETAETAPRAPAPEGSEPLAQEDAAEEVASAEPAPETDTKPQAEEMAKAEPEAVEAETPAETAPADAPDVQPVLVKAVDVEGSRIFIAGSGEPGRSVNLYVDGDYLGTATVGPEGGFLLEATGDLAPGSHEVRADMLAQNGSDVTNRAIVPLIHEVPETEMAKVAPAPKQTAPAEPAPAGEQESAAATEAPATEQTSAAETAPSGSADAEQPARDSAPKVTAQAEPPAEAEEPADKPAGEPAPSAEPAPQAEASGEEPAAQPAQPAETAEGEAPSQAAETPAGETTDDGEAVAETPADTPADTEVEPIRTGASVIIRRGDNLWRISRRMLGEGVKYTVIYEANRDQIRDPHWIYPGQVFEVPGAIREMDRD